MRWKSTTFGAAVSILAGLAAIARTGTPVDLNDKNAPVADNAHPGAGNGLLGKDPAKPDVVIAPMAART